MGTHFAIMEQMSPWQLCGCEENNTYHVYGGNSEDAARHPLNSMSPMDIMRGRMPDSHMVFHEEGGGCVGCLVRRYCGACRPMKIRAMPGSGSGKYQEGMMGTPSDAMYGTPLFEMERPCQPCPSIMCQSLHLYKPSPDGVFGSGEKIGTIRAQCPDTCAYYCCPNFSIKRGDGSEVGKVKGPCCMPLAKKCECCCDIPFAVKRGEEEIGVVNHESLVKGGCMQMCARFCKASASDADTYLTAINDPKATAEDKALILASTVLIDIQFFEASPADAGTD